MKENKSGVMVGNPDMYEKQKMPKKQTPDLNDSEDNESVVTQANPYSTKQKMPKKQTSDLNDSEDNESVVTQVNPYTYYDAVPRGLPEIPRSLAIECSNIIEKNSRKKDPYSKNDSDSKEFYSAVSKSSDGESWNKIKSVLPLPFDEEELSFATKLLEHKMIDEDVLEVVNHAFKKEINLQSAKQKFLSDSIEKNDIEGVKRAFSAGAKIDNGRLRADTPKDTGDVFALNCSSSTLFIDSSSLYSALESKCNKEIVVLLIEKGADFQYILDESQKYPEYFPLPKEKLKILREVVKEKNIDPSAIQDTDHTRTSHAENEKVISQDNQTTPNNKIEPTNKTTLENHEIKHEMINLRDEDPSTAPKKTKDSSKLSKKSQNCIIN